MKSERIVVACALVAAGVVAIVGQQQSQAGQSGVGLSIEPVAGQVHMIQRPDGIANIGVLAGSEGVLLVDSLFGPVADQVVAAVREVTDSDIRFLINTHIHVDHIGGNENLAELGVVIFAHDNTRLRFLADRIRAPRRGGDFRPSPPVGGRPVVTYNDALTFHHSRPDDIWLHARHAAGAHVIMRWTRPERPPAADLEEAAIMAANYSGARGSGQVPVDWTRRKWVRKPRGSAPGAVIPDRVQTVFVAPDPSLAERLSD